MIAVVRFITDKDASHRNDLALFAVQFLDHAGPRARHFHERFVGFHLRERLMLFDAVTCLDLPGDDLSFVNTFAKVRQDEVRFIDGLLDNHSLRRLTAEAQRTQRGWTSWIELCARFRLAAGVR